MTTRIAIGIAALVGLLALPLGSNEYVLALVSRILVFAIVAVSLDLILGYGGMVSFGHAAYFGAGAYVVLALTLVGVHNGFVHLLLAIAIPTMLGLVVGALSVRTRSIYFIMLTFAFAQMLFYFAIGQQQFGGDDGMPLDRRSQFWALDLANIRHMYYLAVFTLVAVLFACDRLVRSRFGMVLQGCRQNETRLQTMGVATYGYKVVAFGVAGGIAGLAGFLMANLNAYVSPNFLDWKVSGDVIMMIVIGGVGTLFGGPIGAAIFLLLQEVISLYTDHWMAVFGPLLVLAALFWKRGVYGFLLRLR